MNNDTFNESVIPMLFSDTFTVSYVLITALILIVGVIGNSLVIYVVIRFSSMQTIANIHLMNLSIADLVFLLSGFIFLSNVIQKSFIFGLIGCKIYLIMTGVNSFTSTYSMTLMSIDRYLAVCHPISSKSIRNPKMTTIIILILWVFSLLLMMPLMIYGDLQSPVIDNRKQNEDDLPNESNKEVNQTINKWDDGLKTTQYACMINWILSGDFASHGFTLYNFALGFLCPVTIICVLYPLVIIRLHNVGPRNKSQERRDSNRRITRLVLAIVLLFIILWLPYWILQLYIIFHPYENNISTYQLISYLNLEILCLNYLNSAINPILYAFMSANFRTSFQQSFLCYRNRRYHLGISTQVPLETLNLTVQKPFKQLLNCKHVTLNQSFLVKAPEPQRCVQLISNN